MRYRYPLIIPRRENPDPAAVYRLYDAEGRSLYVGSSIDPARRLGEHAKKPWWPQVDPSRTMTTWHKDDYAAAVVEYQAAVDDKPLMGKPIPRYGKEWLLRLAEAGYDLTPIHAPAAPVI
ncbi:GIY-YIG nuclease family protein [Streptomyces sp. NPDC005803]|uniref:GIY-YIG nuclease family protein n=1 Tax=Streptomyces sp. NPDC005803 TaxID=3154297 RepID=UPI0033E8014A